MMSKHIEISLVGSGFVALIDEEDWSKISEHKWYLFPYKKRTLYAQNNKGVKMHSLIVDCPSGKVRHHKNGNGLDNRRNNLEIRTHLENAQERAMRSDNKTGLQGIKIRKEKCNFPFMAQITVNGKRLHLGSFKTLEEAKQARIEAEKKYRTPILTKGTEDD